MLECLPKPSTLERIYTGSVLEDQMAVVKVVMLAMYWLWAGRRRLGARASKLWVIASGT